MAQAAPAAVEGTMGSVGGYSVASGSSPARWQEGKLAALRAEVDPSNRHGPRKIWAAIKSMGIQPEDLDAESVKKGLQVSDKIPDAARAARVKEQRLEVREGLRQARLRELERVLEEMEPDDVRRFVRTGDGVRAVRKGDLPETHALAGMNDFHEMQQRQYAKIKAEQQRKANVLGTAFLQEKKRMEEADAQIEALEKRMKDYKKQQDEFWANKRKEAERKAEKRQQGADRAAQDRAEWEEETEKKIVEKLARARSARAHLYSKENLKAKMDESQQKRHKAFQQAVELEQALLARIEANQEALEVRLEERRLRVEEELRQRAAASQAHFDEMQLRVYNQQHEWAENKLKQHAEFKEHCSKVASNLSSTLKERSKSCGDLRKKAYDKWKQNYDKVLSNRGQFHQDLMTRHQEALDRTEARAKLKLKCDNDVFTFREVKQTWGELQQKRLQEYTKSNDAHTQALVFRVAEHQAKMLQQAEGRAEMNRRRQQIAKESLALADRARAGFLKIQCESDEKKIHKMMEDLGFEMPTLPVEEEEHAAEEATKAAF